MIDREYERKLRERVAIFRDATGTRFSTRLTMVTTYGVLKNRYSDVVDDEVTLDDLFVR